MTLFPGITNGIRKFCSSLPQIALCRSQHCPASQICDQAACSKYRNGLIIGLYSNNDGKHEAMFLTKSGEKYNGIICNQIYDLLKRSGPAPGLGEHRIFYDLDYHFNAVAVVGLGPPCQGYNPDEQIDEGKEAIRIASSVGCKALTKVGMDRIATEGFEHTESAAEGTALSLYLYQDHKSCKLQKQLPILELWDDCDWPSWQVGLHKAAAQNLARQLSDTPSNYMTPTLFAQNAVELLCKTGINVEVKVENWCKSEGMNAFLLAAKGSCQTPIFLELSYLGTGNPKDRPIVLIGKGITFNSGGVNLSHPSKINFGRNDMCGAANIVATMRAIAMMNLPINIRGLIPLCENMPGCNAMKPGDIAIAKNGTAILVNDTRAEGRMILADTLAYSQKFWPVFTLDIGNMTRGIRTGLSTAATGVFTNSDSLWKQLRISAAHTGDRVWRMPLFKIYQKRMTSKHYDHQNVGRTIIGGSPCRVASFLREFVPCGEWMHLDNFNTSLCYDKTDPPYIKRGVTGRPTRTLIEFVSQLFCKE